MATKTPKKSTTKVDSSVKKKPTKKSVDAKATTKKTTTTKKATTSVESKKTTSKKVEKKPVKKTDKLTKKHVSEQTKVEKKQPYQLMALITAIILIVLALIYFSLSGGLTSTSVFTTYENNTVIIIEDSTCTLCQVDEFVTGVTTEIDPNAQIIRLEYTDPQAQEFIKEYSLNQVPIVVFTKSFENTELWSQLSVAFNSITYRDNEFYLLTYNTPQIKKILEKPEVSEKSISFGNMESKEIIYEFCSYETALCGLVNGNAQYVSEVLVYNPEYKSLTPNVLSENNAKVVVLHIPQEENIETYVAAFCAEEQNKYVEFRNVLYNNQFEWVPVQERQTILTNYALQVGINVDTFTTCINENSQMYEEQIIMESQIAEEYSISQVPSFIVNNYIIAGPLDFDSYKNILIQ